MNERSERAVEALKGLYLEGEHDRILFGQILSYVSSDNGHVFQKSPVRRITDAIHLIEFLVSSGDFCVGKTERGEGGNIIYKSLSDDLNQVSHIVMRQFKRGGINDIDLLTTIWVEKIVPGSVPKQDISDSIEGLFGSVN